MNASIYLMVSVPYVACVVVGFLIVRGLRKNAEYRKSQQQQSTGDGAPTARMDGLQEAVRCPSSNAVRPFPPSGA
jgi:hypothetical protein